MTSNHAETSACSIYIKPAQFQCRSIPTPITPQNAINVPARFIIIYIQPYFPPVSHHASTTRRSSIPSSPHRLQTGSRSPRTIHTPDTPLVIQPSMRVRTVLVDVPSAGGARRGFHLLHGVLVHGARVGREGELAVF